MFRANPRASANVNGLILTLVQRERALGWKEVGEEVLEDKR
jgi:hypothetical protein